MTRPVICILSEIPISGTWEEVQFDARGDCLWVKFEYGLEIWVGIFGRGIFGLNTVVLFTDERHAFVVANGQGYIVDIEARTVVHRSTNNYLQSAISAGSEYVVACDFSSVTLFDNSSEKWSLHHIARDGIEFHRATSQIIEGRAEQNDGWHDFIIDVATGVLI